MSPIQPIEEQAQSLKVRVDQPTSFNEEVEVYFFRMWETWFTMMVDVATHYKTIVTVPGPDLQSVLRALLQHWLRCSGPMHGFGSRKRGRCRDGTSLLASIGYGRDYPRPAAARNGNIHNDWRGGEGTDLAKIAMMKLRSEAERQGLDVNYQDIAAEASFAKNATSNIGRYTPHMIVDSDGHSESLDP